MQQAATSTGVLPRLDRRRVYIFPTRAGVVLGMMLVVILMGAINYDNALAYVLCFQLGGLFMIAMLHTFHNLAGLQFIGTRAQPVFAGEQAHFECLLSNESARPRLNLLLRNWPRGMKREQRRYLRQYGSHCNLEAERTSAVAITVEANRRGWLKLSRVLIESHYPLGILRAWAYFNCQEQCLVYPAPRGTLPLPAVLTEGQEGADAETDGSETFHGLRPYAAGDPVRAIAWKTLAKEQELMVKKFRGQATRRLWLSYNDLAQIDALEARLSQLCAWVLEADRLGIAFGLKLPGQQIELGRGAEHRAACLRALALHELPDHD